MLVFFVRTQCQHGWKSSPYRFSRRQFDTFQRLMAAAESATKDEASETEVETDEDDEPEGESNNLEPNEEMIDSIHTRNTTWRWCVHWRCWKWIHSAEDSAAPKRIRPFCRPSSK